MNGPNYAKLLDQCLRWADEHDDVAEDRFNVEAFERMRRTIARGGRLSPSQESWIEGVYAKLFDEPTYRNEWSAGAIPRGKEVPTPAVLQNLPLRPPGRKATGR